MEFPEQIRPKSQAKPKLQLDMKGENDDTNESNSVKKKWI